MKKSFFAFAVIVVALLMGIWAARAQTPNPPVTPSQIANDDAAVQAAAINLATAAAHDTADARAYDDQQRELIQNQIDVLQGALTTTQGQVNQLSTSVAAASQAASQALQTAQSIADYPFSNFQLASGKVTFTTLKPVAVWMSGAATIVPWQSRTGCPNTSGTVAPPSPITLSTTFSFQVPSSWPPHGCLNFQAQDANGTAYQHGIVY